MERQPFATGLEFPEGPVCLPNGSMYVVEMSPARCCVTALSQAGERRVIRSTGGRPNGLAIDGNGLIWIAEAMLRAVICIDPDGREVARIGGGSDTPFLLPNDLAFGPDGHLYVTDSGIVLGDFIVDGEFRQDWDSLAYHGCVCEIDPVALKVVRRIDQGMRLANGIAFDAADRLYVNASLTGDVYRYDIFDGGAAERELFANVLQPDDRPIPKGPDGMAFGADGYLYCVVHNQKNVSVIDDHGVVVERLALDGAQPTNVAFSRDGATLLVTEVEKGQVEALAAPCPGLPLHYPKFFL